MKCVNDVEYVRLPKRHFTLVWLLIVKVSPKRQT